MISKDGDGWHGTTTNAFGKSSEFPGLCCQGLSMNSIYPCETRLRSSMIWTKGRRPFNRGVLLLAIGFSHKLMKQWAYTRLSPQKYSHILAWLRSLSTGEWWLCPLVSWPRPYKHIWNYQRCIQQAISEIYPQEKNSYNINTRHKR